MVLLIGVLLTLIMGFVLLDLLLRNADLLEKLSLSMPVGFGVLSLLMYYSSAIGIKINIINCAVIQIFLIAITVYFRNRLHKGSQIRPKKDLINIAQVVKSMTKIEKIAMAVIFGILILSFIETAFFPVSTWDSLALYDFRAKIIAEVGYFVQIASQYKYFGHYPLLTSLSHVWVYILGGKNPLFLYSLFFASFALIFYLSIREYLTRLFSLLFTILVMTYPDVYNHSVIAYTNLPYIIYYFAGIVYLWKFTVKNKFGNLLLSALLIGLSNFTRSTEPFWITPIIIAGIYLIYKKRIVQFIFYSAIIFLIKLSWDVFMVAQFGENYSFKSQIGYIGEVSGGIALGKLVSILTFVYKNVLAVWPGTWLFFVIIFLSETRKLKIKRLFAPAVIFLNIGILVAGSYILSVKVTYWELLYDSIKRVSMIFIPLIVYFAATSEIVSRLARFSKNN